jgi:phosphoserine phosphatase
MRAMTDTLILVAPRDRRALEADLVSTARDALAQSGAEPGPIEWLSPGEACEIPFADGEGARALLADALRGAGIDHAMLPAEGRRKRLLVADMDATIVVGETLDDLATLAGFGDEVAAMTARSVKGEMDFAASLEARVRLLEGVSEIFIGRVADKIELMPGAVELVRTMRANGAYTALVSGGFTPFTSLVRAQVGFDIDIANVLAVRNGKLTGRLSPPIITREGKRKALERLSARKSLARADTMAVGDGANDLDMIQHAGLGIAYHAQPVVREAVDVKVDHADLTALLFYQGYRRDEFVS